MQIYYKNKQEYNTKSFRWHIFSGGGLPSSEGSEAQEEYDAHHAYEYQVMSNEDSNVEIVKEKPKDLNFQDVYVFPKNMAWTMAFTHEEGWLGPYFAKHPKYNELEKENALYKIKLEQIEQAKKNGWC